MAHRGNYLDLDPTYRDSFGRPMLRMTFDFTDNELKMSRYLVDKAAEIGLAMEGVSSVKKNYRTGSWSVVPYQTTHNTGGTIMGDNPTNSVVNKYLAELGRAQPVRDRRGRLPAECGLQPDRHGGGAGVPVRRRDQEPVPEEPRPAGSRMPEGTGHGVPGSDHGCPRSARSCWLWRGRLPCCGPRAAASLHADGRDDAVNQLP